MNLLHLLWIIPCGLLGLLVLMLFFTVRVRIRLDKQLELWLGFGPGNLHVYPKQKRKKPKAKAVKPAQEKPEKTEEQGTSVSPQMMLRLFQFGVHHRNELLRHIRIPELTLHLTVGDSDAAKTAILYGAAAAVTSTVIPPLETACHIRELDVSVNADFQGTQSVLLDMTVSAMLFKLALSVWKLYCRFKRLQNTEINATDEKGGFQNEQSE